jgi:hypothetical protein
MGHRPDLEELLLSGLPSMEQQHVVRTIRETVAAKLRYKRSLRDPNFHERPGDAEASDA